MFCNLYCTVPCTVAVSNCGRMLSEEQDFQWQYLQIRAPGKGWTLFSLAAHPRPLDCSCRAESRANKSMRSHPPAYSHLTSTCTSILRLITCSHRIYQYTANRLAASISIRRPRHPCLSYIPESRYQLLAAAGRWVCASQQFHRINAQRSFSWELIKFSNSC
jgi:hypothetical protein